MRSTIALGALFAALPLAPYATAQAVLQRVEGGADWDHFGTSVAGAGDVDGDGRADWIVGADAGDEYGPLSGYAHVYSGDDGALLHELGSSSPQDRFGHTVAGLGGDANGDGCDDVLVSAHRASWNGGQSGRVWLFSGRDGSVLLTVDGSAPLAQLGFALAGAGDLDGDGVPDFAASSHFLRRVDVFSGADGALLLTIPGPAAAIGFGRSLDLAGDLDGDGVGDLIVGAPEDSSVAFQGGCARVYSGASGVLLLELFGSGTHGAFGGAVAGLGDVDGDGVDDVAVGAPDDDTVAFNAGALRVYSGASGALLLERFGLAANDRYGFSLAGPGDVDGDGVPDLLTGSPFLDTPASTSGVLHLISGQSGALVLSENGPPGARLGHSVAAVGDVNGDGVPELAVGAPFLTPQGFDFERGFADLLDGAVLPVAPYCIAASNSTGAEAHIAQLGRTDVSANDFTLAANGLPALAPCLFLMAPEAQRTPFGGGWLCLGGTVQRLVPALLADDHGRVWRPVDLTAPASGAAPIRAGDRRCFQLWYRDLAAVGAGFNLSDGLVATFGP